MKVTLPKFRKAVESTTITFLGAIIGYVAVKSYNCGHLSLIELQELLRTPSYAIIIMIVFVLQVLSSLWFKEG